MSVLQLKRRQSEVETERHARTLQRALVLLARLPEHEAKLAPEVWAVQRGLRELLEVLEDGQP